MRGSTRQRDGTGRIIGLPRIGCGDEDVLDDQVDRRRCEAATVATGYCHHQRRALIGSRQRRQTMEGAIARQVGHPGIADRHIPWHASFAELAHEADRMERAVKKMLAAHRSRDMASGDDDDTGLNVQRVKRLQQEAARVRDFLARNTERKSPKGTIRKSNVTDNDSAKMATAKGVIQGYTAVAAVDGAHQVIVAASAHGSGSEQSTLLPTVAQTDAVRSPQTLITADAGYHSEANLKALYEQGIPALVADGLMRRRDERFKHQDKYKALPDPLANKGAPDKTTELFGPKDFS